MDRPTHWLATDWCDYSSAVYHWRHQLTPITHTYTHVHTHTLTQPSHPWVRFF
jgi:hypothetical protein